MEKLGKVLFCRWSPASGNSKYAPSGRSLVQVNKKVMIIILRRRGHTGIRSSEIWDGGGWTW